MEMGHIDSALVDQDEQTALDGSFHWLRRDMNNMSLLVDIEAKLELYSRNLKPCIANIKGSSDM